MKKILIQKQEIIEQVSKKINNSTSIAVFVYNKLKAEEITLIRKELKNNNAELKIYKNTLFNLGAIKANYPQLTPYLIGLNAFVFIKNDQPLTIFKLLISYFKKNKELEFKAGIYENEVISGKQLTQIAKLPSKQEMIAIFASSLLYPVRMFAIAIKEIAIKKSQN